MKRTCHNISPRSSRDYFTAGIAADFDKYATDMPPTQRVMRKLIISTHVSTHY